MTKPDTSGQHGTNDMNPTNPTTPSLEEDLDIRIAIAETCGWKWMPPSGLLHPAKAKNWAMDPESQDEIIRDFRFDLPDYAKSLDAMAMAERHLKEKPSWWTAFNAELFKVASGVNLMDGSASSHDIWNVIHSTARQRAEAFLRAVGKWKEE